MIYLFTAPFNQGFTNFSKHALFVPTMYQVCFASIKAQPLSYIVKDNVQISLKNQQMEVPPHIIKTDSKKDVIPETRVVNNALSLYTRNQVSEPGFYTVSKAGSELLPLAFNFSRKESVTNANTSEELQNIINTKGWRNVNIIGEAENDIARAVMQGAEGKKLWKLFIFLALVFIAIEAALLRFLK